jgi:hypothetical protein
MNFKMTTTSMVDELIRLRMHAIFKWAYVSKGALAEIGMLADGIPPTPTWKNGIYHIGLKKINHLTDEGKLLILS